MGIFSPKSNPPVNSVSLPNLCFLSPGKMVKDRLCQSGLRDKVVTGKCASGTTPSLSCPWHLQPGCLPVNKGLQEIQLHIPPAGCCTIIFPLDHWSVRQLSWVGLPKALILFINLQGDSDSAILSPHCRIL